MIIFGNKYMLGKKHTEKSKQKMSNSRNARIKKICSL